MGNREKRQILNTYGVTGDNFHIWFRYYLRGLYSPPRQGIAEMYAKEKGMKPSHVKAVWNGSEQPCSVILKDMRLKAYPDHEKEIIKYRQLSSCQFKEE